MTTPPSDLRVPLPLFQTHLTHFEEDIEAFKAETEPSRLAVKPNALFPEGLRNTDCFTWRQIREQEKALVELFSQVDTTDVPIETFGEVSVKLRILSERLRKTYAELFLKNVVSFQKEVRTLKAKYEADKANPDTKAWIWSTDLYPLYGRKGSLTRAHEELMKTDNDMLPKDEINLSIVALANAKLRESLADMEALEAYQKECREEGFYPRLS